MRIKIQQFLFGQSHSWAHVGKETGRALINMGHSVDFISTDGLSSEFVPKDLENYVRIQPSGIYDCQFSYTAMMNFPKYLDKNFGGKRFGMWAYEFDTLPEGFARHASYVDKFLVPSDWFKDICQSNKIDPNKLVTVPHGVRWQEFSKASKINLRTEKKIKVLINFAQPHLRKNIPGTLEAIGKAFTDKNDICFVMKVKDLKPKQKFEISFSEEYKKIKQKYKNFPEVIIFKDYIPDMYGLYKSCQVFFMIPNAEAFFLPALEALAANQIVITSKYGGQMDFLNEKNSFLVEGKEVRADRNAFYWNSSAYGKWFLPDINDAVDKLKYVYQNFDSLYGKEVVDEAFKKKYSWENGAKIIEELCM
jgi:glycosyltransferase involved in cell wall biosynthesis